MGNIQIRLPKLEEQKKNLRCFQKVTWTIRDT